MKNKLILITDNYPFGRGEEFIIDEIPFLESRFDLTIIASNVTEEKTKELNPSVIVHRYSPFKKSYQALKYIPQMITDLEFWKEALRILKTKKLVSKRLKDIFLFYAKGLDFRKYLFASGIINKNSECILYFYWMNYKLLSVLAKGLNLSNCKVVARTHGYDLYDFRNIYGRQPFRELIDKKIDRIYFVSDYGKGYYLSNHKKTDGKKYTVAKLGIINEGKINPIEKPHTFTMVSCSNMIPLKRIDLIIWALSMIEDFSLNWIHFGDGSARENLEKLATELLSNKQNIKYEFKGHVNNSVIHEFYQTTPVDSFITTSSTEGGCPVSIQAAMSYGIPIIGTNAGGIPETICGNGFLLEADSTPEEVAKAIMKIGNMDKDSIAFMREKSRSKWEKEFDANINFEKFADDLNDI
ncbi:glycosyltransferase [Alkalibacter mobilis]|uniref:glycosyltransferase n=1 Tax=Alkalibacter mobilis TaxID=2787712 RepID=UPI00189FE20E|nr:glycosyltransferase [Alkalibacter mobilis]MBF7096120.1 glycosyltransferase [Alkalibacter mobilis]